MRAKTRAPRTLRARNYERMSTNSNGNAVEDFAGERAQELLTEDTQAYTLAQEKAQLEAMNRELTQMILKMNALSYQGLLLNVDVVSQFDPAVVQKLSGLVEDCEACIARIKERTEQSFQCLQSHTSTGDSVVQE